MGVRAFMFCSALIVTTLCVPDGTHWGWVKAREFGQRPSLVRRRRCHQLGSFVRILRAALGSVPNRDQ